MQSAAMGPGSNGGSALWNQAGSIGSTCNPARNAKISQHGANFGMNCSLRACFNVQTRLEAECGCTECDLSREWGERRRDAVDGESAHELQRAAQLPARMRASILFRARVVPLITRTTNHYLHHHKTLPQLSVSLLTKTVVTAVSIQSGADPLKD